MCEDCWDEADDYSPEFDWDDRDPEPHPEPDDDWWDDELLGPPKEEPDCLGPGCYDSGFDWRGRRCRGCNPTRWQSLVDRMVYQLARPWRWLDRKLHPRAYSDEPPF